MSFRQEIMGEWHEPPPVTVRAALRSDEVALSEQAERLTSKGRGLNLPPFEGESLAAYAARLDAAVDAKYPRTDAAPGPSVARFG